VGSNPAGNAKPTRCYFDASGSIDVEQRGAVALAVEK